MWQQFNCNYGKFKSQDIGVVIGIMHGPSYLWSCRWAYEIHKRNSKGYSITEPDQTNSEPHKMLTKPKWHKIGN